MRRKPWLFFARIALFLVVALPCCLSGCLIPRDREISSRFETILRKKLHPEFVQVTLHRASMFSMTIRSLDINITGFSVGKTTTLAAAPWTITPAHIAEAALLAWPDPAEVARGRLLRAIDVHLHCERFSVGNLPVRQMDVQLHEIRVPLGNLEHGHLMIAAAASAHGSVLFDEAGLTKFLKTRHLPVKNPSVQLTTDGCVLRGDTDTFISAPVELTGRLAVKDQAVLFLDQPRIHVAAFTMTAAMSERLLTRINPLIDLNHDLPIPVPISIMNVTQGDGQLRFDAELHFPPLR
jgi:hypothetical protein